MNAQRVAEFTIKLPAAADALGRWMDKYGASLELSCALGQYSACVKWGKLHHYQTGGPTHRETWELSRQSPNPTQAISSALGDAMEMMP